MKDIRYNIKNLRYISRFQEPSCSSKIAANFPYKLVYPKTTMLLLDLHIFKLQSTEFFFSIRPAYSKTAKAPLNQHVLKL